VRRDDLAKVVVGFGEGFLDDGVKHIVPKLSGKKFGDGSISMAGAAGLVRSARLSGLDASVASRRVRRLRSRSDIDETCSVSSFFTELRDSPLS
jgi:hypothetical protein